MIDRGEIIKRLMEKNYIDQKYPVVFEPLTGGVSSNLWLIDNVKTRYVLKEARHQLKVADHWEADLSRNFAEQKYIRFVSQFAPHSVPEIILNQPDDPYFVMEFLKPPLQNWKQKLLKGHFDPYDIYRTVQLLSQIHNTARKHPEVPHLFDYPDNFYTLRIEPYLITTGHRNPALNSFFEAEAQRLHICRETLVHGDYSPKNILLDKNRIVLLDHEVAHYGDPAFDLAFLINHLILKKIYFGPTTKNQPDLPKIAWDTYFNLIEVPVRKTLERRTSHLLWMLLLSRVDGKSPVEYLDQQKQDFIRHFVHLYLPTEKSYDFFLMLRALKEMSDD